jgi:hypothetical protein
MDRTRVCKEEEEDVQIPFEFVVVQDWEGAAWRRL